jgi:hypothetical protein
VTQRRFSRGQRFLQILGVSGPDHVDQRRVEISSPYVGGGMCSGESRADATEPRSCG